MAAEDTLHHHTQSISSSQDRQEALSTKPTKAIQQQTRRKEPEEENLVQVSDQVQVIWPEPIKHISKSGGMGGSFHPNCDGFDEEGNIKQIQPSVAVTSSNRGSNVKWTITSITIYRCILAGTPSKEDIPKVGVNLTNDKKDGVRNDNGKGYWKDVIRNLQHYKNGEVAELRWYLPCSEIHETNHDTQYQAWFAKNRAALLNNLACQLEDFTKTRSMQPANAEVEEKAGRYLHQILFSEYASTQEGEKVAYGYTFNECWMPEIKKIEESAKERGWK